jgi:uncharacterized protein (DUF302 family)
MESMGETQETSKEQDSFRVTPNQLRDFRSVLSFLNEKDRDILFLVFCSGKKQKEVETIIKRSQPSLCYDIKRIRRRVRFISYLNSVLDVFISFVESKHPDFGPFEMDVLTLMFYTSSFTVTAEVIGCSQVKVRYSFDRCLAKLAESQAWEVYEIFTVVRNNLNLVRRTYKRKIDGGGRLNGVYVPI